MLESPYEEWTFSDNNILLGYHGTAIEGVIKSLGFVSLDTTGALCAGEEEPVSTEASSEEIPPPVPEPEPTPEPAIDTSGIGLFIPKNGEQLPSDCFKGSTVAVGAVQDAEMTNLE